MSLDDCWAETVIFNDKYFPNWRKSAPMSMTNGMAGELGETLEIWSDILMHKYASKLGIICNMMKKMCGGGTNIKKIPTMDEFIEEMVDIDIYKILLLGTLNVDRKAYIQAYANKLNKIYARMEGNE